MQKKRPAIKKVRITTTKQVKRRVKVQRHVHEFEGSTKRLKKEQIGTLH